MGEKVNFNFEKNSVESITLDTLKATRNETNFGFQPFNGIIHFNFIEAIFNKLGQSNLKGELVELYAGAGGSKIMPGVSFVGNENDEESKKDINNWIFRRIIGKILIEKLSRPDMQMGIAFSYHQLGVELAMGPHIYVCKNFSIIGKKSYIHTYGNEKIPNVTRMIEILGDWCGEYEDETVQQFQTIDGMTNIQVSDEEVKKLIGDLTLKRIRHDSKKIEKGEFYPMNQSQISRFAERYAVAENKSKEPLTVYDIYNFGTEMYKPGDTDFPNVLSANHRFGSHIKQFFNLN